MCEVLDRVPRAKAPEGVVGLLEAVGRWCGASVVCGVGRVSSCKSAGPGFHEPGVATENWSPGCSAAVSFLYGNLSKAAMAASESLTNQRRASHPVPSTGELSTRLLLPAFSHQAQAGTQHSLSHTMAVALSHQHLHCSVCGLGPLSALDSLSHLSIFRSVHLDLVSVSQS